MQSIQEIDEILKNTSFEQLKIGIDSFRFDERKGVQKLLDKYEKKLNDYVKELTRLDGMMLYERKYAEYEYICGIDEAGRGPLAGPVVAAAVILPKEHPILYANDSKQLSEAKREELYDIIMKEAVSVGVGVIGEKKIDEVNILQATYLAMQQAVHQLDPQPQILLNDAVRIPNLEQKQVPIIKGDAKSLSIACASIIAKVTRDRLMREYDKLYPEYGFAGHKGYGCASHIEAIKTYGPCPIHRATFIKNFVNG